MNGFFLFDVLLPNDYPDKAPNVKFLTTGGGAVRFNP
jgi:baculoviral IAP repeat-containing protein 6